MKLGYKNTLWLFPFLSILGNQVVAFHVSCPTPKEINQTVCHVDKDFPEKCERSILAKDKKDDDHGYWTGHFYKDNIDVKEFVKADRTASFIPRCIYKTEEGSENILINIDLDSEGCLPEDGSFQCSRGTPQA